MKIERQMSCFFFIYIYIIYPGIKLIKILITIKYSNSGEEVSKGLSLFFKIWVQTENVCLEIFLILTFSILYRLLNTKHKFELWRNRK